ncbi:hypothetical protein FQN54_001592 [Arachnomyces sp. PD_36]|nr:hypothetical protein FQN54_001592 [Arachnomyces sp. PD_36]
MESLVQVDREISGSGNDQKTPLFQIEGVPTDTLGISPLASGGSRRESDVAPRPYHVEKPVTLAQKENPRKFQLNQLRRRFHPEESAIGNATSLSFKLTPSDPDFPFELEALECVMLIPSTYPEAGMPTLRVLNEEIGNKLQIKVEKAFHTLVDTDLKRKKSGTLLGYMNIIDKQLEQLLSGRTLQTFKFVGNISLKSSNDSTPGEVASEAPLAIPQVAPKPGDKFTSSEKSAAEARRSDEIRQLEARLGRIPLFSKSPDGTTFTVPIQPNRPERLPVPLRAIRSVKLLVPPLYPLERCEIELSRVSKADARSTECAFRIWSASKKEANLSARINYLAHNMHIMANRPLSEEDEVLRAVEEPVAPVEDPVETPAVAVGSVQPSIFDEHVLDRSHVHVVPRPPEWSMPNDEVDSDDSDDYDSEIYYSEDEDNEDGGVNVPDLPEPACQILLSFPFVELYGIELLEVRSLHVTVKCDRCKEIMDVKGVRPGDGDEKGPVKVESCKKCANYMSIGELSGCVDARLGSR